MPRWCRDRAGQGAVVAFVIWVIAMVFIYALSQGQASSDALNGVVRAAGLRTLQWAGRSALNEVDYRMRRPNLGVDVMGTIQGGGTPSPVEATATADLYKDELASGVLTVGAVEIKLVTPVRDKKSKEPWFIDLAVPVTYRLGRNTLQRRLRRRLVAYNQPMTVILGPGADPSDPTKGVFDATLCLEQNSLLEVMEQ